MLPQVHRAFVIFTVWVFSKEEATEKKNAPRGRISLLGNLISSFAVYQARNHDNFATVALVQRALADPEVGLGVALEFEPAAALAEARHLAVAEVPDDRHRAEADDQDADGRHWDADGSRQRRGPKIGVYRRRDRDLDPYPAPIGDDGRRLFPNLLGRGRGRDPSRVFVNHPGPSWEVAHLCQSAAAGRPNRALGGCGASGPSRDRNPDRGSNDPNSFQH